MGELPILPSPAFSFLLFECTHRFLTECVTLGIHSNHRTCYWVMFFSPNFCAENGGRKWEKDLNKERTKGASRGRERVTDDGRVLQIVGWLSVLETGATALVSAMVQFDSAGMPLSLLCASIGKERTEQRLKKKKKGPSASRKASFGVGARHWLACPRRLRREDFTDKIFSCRDTGRAPLQAELAGSQAHGKAYHPQCLR